MLLTEVIQKIFNDGSFTKIFGLFF